MKKIIILIGSISLILSVKFFVPTIRLDGYSGTFNRIILNRDDTLYTSKYSNTDFLSIKKEMLYNEVILKLGKPFSIEKLKGGYLRLTYSRFPKDTHYRVRQIIMKENKVDDVISYFYID